MRYAEITDEAAAWHGTRYKFDKFSTEFLGSGEGFNTFGWGLYFTSKREIADFYRKKLSKESGETGHVYQVSLPEEDEKYLFWDKRLSEQPKAVRTAALSFLKITVSKPIKYDWGTNCSIRPNLRLSETDIQERNGRFQVFALDGEWEMRREFTNLDDAIKAAKKKIIEQLFRQTGENFYEDLKWQFNTAKDSSLALLKQGIYGIKYGESRSKKEGSYNYVIFDPSHINISEISS